MVCPDVTGTDILSHVFPTSEWVLLLYRHHQTSYKSSRPDLFCEKGVLKNFLIFTGKHLCRCCEIFKNTYFEENLRTNASEFNGFGFPTL